VSHSTRAAEWQQRIFDMLMPVGQHATDDQHPRLSDNAPKVGG
jgi:hypothetical protein